MVSLSNVLHDLEPKVLLHNVRSLSASSFKRSHRLTIGCQGVQRYFLTISNHLQPFGSLTFLPLSQPGSVCTFDSTSSVPDKLVDRLVASRALTNALTDLKSFPPSTHSPTTHNYLPSPRLDFFEFWLASTSTLFAFVRYVLPSLVYSAARQK